MHPLTHLGDRIQGLTYGEMMEFAAEVRELMVERDLIDPQIISVADFAAALAGAGIMLFARER